MLGEWTSQVTSRLIIKYVTCSYFGAVLKASDNAEYYTPGSNACKDYMGELAPFAPERQLELFEEIRTDILRNLDSGAV